MSSANVGGLPGLEHANPVFLLSRLLLEHKMVAVSKTRSSQAAMLGAKSWMCVWQTVSPLTRACLHGDAEADEPAGIHPETHRTTIRCFLRNCTRACCRPRRMLRMFCLHGRMIFQSPYPFASGDHLPRLLHGFMYDSNGWRVSIQLNQPKIHLI